MGGTIRHAKAPGLLERSARNGRKTRRSADDACHFELCLPANKVRGPSDELELEDEPSRVAREVDAWESYWSEEKHLRKSEVPRCMCGADAKKECDAFYVHLDAHWTHDEVTGWMPHVHGARPPAAPRGR